MPNIYQSFTYKMAAKINWHRYGTKLRHCRPMYRGRRSNYHPETGTAVLVAYTAAASSSQQQQRRQGNIRPHTRYDLVSISRATDRIASDAARGAATSVE